MRQLKRARMSLTGRNSLASSGVQENEWPMKATVRSLPLQGTVRTPLSANLVAHEPGWRFGASTSRLN
eukprot:5783608-Prymnesium_polylepis.1